MYKCELNCEFSSLYFEKVSTVETIILEPRFISYIMVSVCMVVCVRECVCTYIVHLVWLIIFKCTRGARAKCEKKHKTLFYCFFLHFLRLLSLILNLLCIYVCLPFLNNSYFFFFFSLIIFPVNFHHHLTNSQFVRGVCVLNFHAAGWMMCVIV